MTGKMLNRIIIAAIIGAWLLGIAVGIDLHKILTVHP